ncbi:hypothetical protein L6164_023069 [Bauhinia variegata]|uniref:Uncharacterized protein n=1 Tax=Bauhinia variegata TaxID=167791 RepID=A0ACB9MHE7_BAUVA|nr:hypothetical protein L6164_023069 [Bauhinia variegata]
MEGEIIKLTELWFSVFISLCFCYWISKVVPTGTKRLVCVIPIICLYLFLPLTISSVHFGGIVGFFIAWLANFKLLLFAFGKGPLASDPSISLPRFIALACLPIKIQQNSPQKQTPRSKITQNSNQFDQNGKISSQNPQEEHKKSQIEKNPDRESKQNPSTTKGYMTFLQYAIKGVTLAIMVKIYEYSDHIHPKLILGLYCFHVYFLLELILAMVAALARSILGMELEPQFNNPLLSTSLQDFWGRRWNLMVSSILRPTVYEPTLVAGKRLIGPKWAPLPAVLGTFMVSALMHELIFYYMGRKDPTFRMTWFFLLHGFCLTVEMALKKSLTARWQLPRLISGPLTAGFVITTCFWLFIPEFIRCQIDVRAFEEYAALGAFAKNVTQVFLI